MTTCESQNVLQADVTTQAMGDMAELVSVRRLFRSRREALCSARNIVRAVAICLALAAGAARAAPGDGAPATSLASSTQTAAATRPAPSTRAAAGASSAPATRAVASMVSVVASQPAERPAPSAGSQDLRVGLLDPGRLVSAALVVAGLVLLVKFWRRSWEVSPEGTARERDRLFCLVGTLLVLYGLLFNGQWVPGGGDEAYYLSIGRSIGQTGEFSSNGLPVVTVPYGWPYLIAGAMKISTSFVFLNLMPLGLVLTALVLWYVILRRVTEARTAFAAVIVSAILFHWQRGAVHFYSEPLYFALVAAGTVLSLQIAEGRSWGVLVAGLLLLCVGLVLSRFAGLLTLPLLAAALLCSPGRPTRRQWIALGLMAATLGGSFLGMRALLARNARNDLAKMDQVIKRQGKKPTVTANRVRALRQTSEREIAVQGRILGRAVKAGKWEYLRRIGQSGVWMSRLLWPPAELGKNNDRVLMASNVAGWLLIGVLLVHVADALRRRQWLWLGALGYFLGFVVVWPEPNGRYIAGVAPMLLLGLWLGARKLGVLLEGTAWRKPITVASVALIGSILVCNVPIYAMEVWINQSPQFHSRVLAGEHAELAGLCRYLNAQSLQDDQLAVPPDDVSLQIVRVVNLLTGRTVFVWPGEGCPTKALLKWAQEKHVKYFACPSSNAPHRLWHVQLAPATQNDPANPPGYVALYEIRDGQFVRIQPQDRWAVDRMFGMEDTP